MPLAQLVGDMSVKSRCGPPPTSAARREKEGKTLYLVIFTTGEPALTAPSVASTEE